MNPEIVLGSKSQGKFLGASRALLAVRLDAFKLFLVDMDSGENRQPREEETLRGARTRAFGAQATRPGSWGLGIENGQFLVNDEWRDAADIVLVDPDGHEYRERSEYVVFPTDVVEEAQRRGFATTTAGSVLAERTGCAATDPHSFLTDGKKPRAKFLEEVLIRLFNRVFNAKEGHMSQVHEVSIGSVRRQLPIREVAPGVKVALCNLLGDWEATEAAGAQLIQLMPDGVEVLVMPDGKAQALLHVLGRLSRLPTLVARKEKKPYMGECVSVEVKSITTNRVQKLFMSSSDADLLRGKRVAVMDDVVSTGATLKAMKQLLEQVGAIYVCTLAAFTEGPEEHPDVLATGNLPLF